MNQIIPIGKHEFSGSLKQTVNARELYAFLGVQSRFNDWIKNRIAEYGFVENQDFVSFTKNLVKPTGGRPCAEYALTLDMAKELSMVERTEKGKQARQYFIECERRAQSAAPAIPQTLPEALRLAADLAEQNQKQAARLAEVEPKAAALDGISEAAGDLCLTDAAKTLGVAPRRLTDWMQAQRWIHKRNGATRWIAYQPKILSGYLRHVEHIYTSKSTGEERISSQVRVTAKGLTTLAVLLQREQKQ